jgi:glycerate kinase
MRVLVCPDKFAGTLTAVEAATAIVAGWRSAAPDDELTARPLSDGGPGFIEVLAAGPSGRSWKDCPSGKSRKDCPSGKSRKDSGGRGRRIPVPTCDPLGRPVTGEVLLTAEAGYLESAHACGLHLLTAAERDPLRTTSFGLGTLIAAAVESGARTVVIGLGGSATNDGGAGMLAALGAVAVDAAGYAVPYGGAALAACTAVVGAPRLRDATLVAATDVDNPLTGPYGASAVYGPQKGATPRDIELLDAALGRFATILERDLPDCPPDLAGLAGAGAAGGLGAAILALGGRCGSGIELVRRSVRFDDALAGADLVITGEGSFDEQSLRGKVVAGVAGAAREHGVPCLVVAGRVSAGSEDSARAGVTGTYSLVEHFGEVDRALAEPAEGLREIAADLARSWSAQAR